MYNVTKLQHAYTKKKSNVNRIKLVAHVVNPASKSPVHYPDGDLAHKGAVTVGTSTNSRIFLT